MVSISCQKTERPESFTKALLPFPWPKEGFLLSRCLLPSVKCPTPSGSLAGPLSAAKIFPLACWPLKLTIIAEKAGANYGA